MTLTNNQAAQKIQRAFRTYSEQNRNHVNQPVPPIVRRPEPDNDTALRPFSAPTRGANPQE